MSDPLSDLAHKLDLSSSAFGTAGESGELLGSVGGEVSSPEGDAFDVFDAGVGEDVSVEIELIQGGAGIDVCGGFIGKEKSKFCCAELVEGTSGCGLASHVRKANLVPGCAYIRCPPTRGQKTPCAYLRPFLNTKPLPDSFKAQMSRSQPVSGWHYFFATVQETTDDLPQAGVEDLLERGSRPVTFKATPAKSLRQPFVTTNWTEPYPTEAFGPLPNASPDSTDDEVVLGAQLKAVLRVLSEMRDRVPKAEGAVLKLSSETADAIEKVDSKVMGLYGLTGEPDGALVESAPSPQLWGCVESLLSSLQGHEDLISDMKRNLVTDPVRFERCPEDYRFSGRSVEAGQRGEGSGRWPQVVRVPPVRGIQDV